MGKTTIINVSNNYFCWKIEFFKKNDTINSSRKNSIKMGQ